MGRIETKPQEWLVYADGMYKGVVRKDEDRCWGFEWQGYWHQFRRNASLIEVAREIRDMMPGAVEVKLWLKDARPHRVVKSPPLDAMTVLVERGLVKDGLD